MNNPITRVAISFADGTYDVELDNDRHLFGDLKFRNDLLAQLVNGKRVAGDQFIDLVLRAKIKRATYRKADARKRKRKAA